MKLQCYFKILMSPSFIRNSFAFPWTLWQQWFIHYFQDHAPAHENKIAGGSKIKIIHCQGTEAQNYFSLNRIRGVGGRDKNLACSPSYCFPLFVLSFLTTILFFFSCWSLRATLHLAHPQIRLFLATYGSNDKYSPNNIYWTLIIFLQKKKKQAVQVSLT